jgi:ATP-binding cassette subfamily B protein
MIGGLYYIQGGHDIDLPTIVEFVLYINMLTFPVSAIGLTASMMQRAAASQKRINEFLETKPFIREPVKPANVDLQGNIHFDHVNFIYKDTGIQALRDFNLHIKKGERIAIVGRTGSGKTTVAQLLLRMYDPTEGLIRLDDSNIKDISLKSLREQVSYVPQYVFLFSDTVHNNIAFGVDKTDAAAVEKAAIQAGVHKEILNFPDGYQTMIGERGVTLSGGQKQRISIARALLKNPAIVIFDDCLSAVDAKTENQITNNLNEYLADKTAIVITHRIFSLFKFDRIIVLEDGEIVEQGTHRQLLEQKGFYAALYARQQAMETEV